MNHIEFYNLKKGTEWIPERLHYVNGWIDFPSMMHIPDFYAESLINEHLRKKLEEYNIGIVPDYRCSHQMYVIYNCKTGQAILLHDTYESALFAAVEWVEENKEK
jgi:hypothetical protein